MGPIKSFVQSFSAELRHGDNWASRTRHGREGLNTHGWTSDSGDATLTQQSFQWVETTVRKVDLDSEACRTSTLHSDA